MKTKRETMLTKFSEGLSYALEEQEQMQPVTMMMYDRFVGLLFIGITKSGWYCFNLIIKGGSANGNYIGFLYDALLSVLRRTDYETFRISKRQRNTVRIEMSKSNKSYWSK